jgi:hypothetical protein
MKGDQASTPLLAKPVVARSTHRCQWSFMRVLPTEPKSDFALSPYATTGSASNLCLLCLQWPVLPLKRAFTVHQRASFTDFSTVATRTYETLVAMVRVSRPSPISRVDRVVIDEFSVLALLKL